MRIDGELRSQRGVGVGQKQHRSAHVSDLLGLEGAGPDASDPDVGIECCFSCCISIVILLLPKKVPQWEEDNSKGEVQFPHPPTPLAWTHSNFF